MQRSGRLVMGVVLALGLLGAVPASAFAAPLSCGDTLTASRTLTANLDCSAYAGTALFIGANGVTLDLNGHTITGFAGDDSHSGVYVNEFKNVTITDGTIKDFGYGVYLYNAISNTVSWLTVMGEAADTGDYGVYVDYGVGNKIKRNTVDGQATGIYLEYSASNVVSYNEATATSEAFYAYEESYDTFSNNTAHGDDYGFYEYDSGGNRYLNNTSNDGDFGFYMECNGYGVVKLIGNTANSNSSDGFYTYECYYGNDINSEPAPRSVIRGNTANYNGDDGFEDYYSVNAIFTQNIANHNGDDGLDLDYPGDIVITWNRTNHNGDSGIELVNALAPGYGGPAALSYNTAKWNSYGLYSDYGVPKHKTVGNYVRYNTVQNCTNVFC